MLSERPELKIIRSVRDARSRRTQHSALAIQTSRKLDRYFPDYSRRTPTVDPDDHHLFVSLGCAAENLSLATTAAGQLGDISFSSKENGSVAFTFGAGRRSGSALFEAIPARQSTRANYDGRTIKGEDLKALETAASVPGLDFVLITDRQQIVRVSDLVVAGNTAQMADAAFVQELKSWLRFNPRGAIQTGDGLFSASSGSP